MCIRDRSYTMGLPEFHSALAFQLLDKDRNGYIDRNSFLDFASPRCPGIQDFRIRYLFDLYTDREGRMDYSCFLKFLLPALDLGYFDMISKRQDLKKLLNLKIPQQNLERAVASLIEKEISVDYDIESDKRAFHISERIFFELYKLLDTRKIGFFGHEDLNNLFLRYGRSLDLKAYKLIRRYFMRNNEMGPITYEMFIDGMGPRIFYYQSSMVPFSPRDVGDDKIVATLKDDSQTKNLDYVRASIFPAQNTGRPGNSSPGRFNERVYGRDMSAMLAGVGPTTPAPKTPQSPAMPPESGRMPMTRVGAELMVDPIASPARPSVRRIFEQTPL
eukprot:TRINITY_DN19733_c0_g1_i1.p1 TRINITY_DN19733_c0_g1~~TRINITY_DN19733_c0_g1_i1.p1  ORF type:complete len:351 (-),score=104.62 TRINITY_DN19733_c0_g1_i1:156-1148(-)